jgi:acyl carrier protein
MDEKEIIRLTNSIFVESFEIEPDRLKPEAKIFEDLGLDSLDIVELVVGLQKKFGVKLRDSEKLREIRTLADVYKFMLEEKARLEKGDAPA